MKHLCGQKHDVELVCTILPDLQPSTLPYIGVECLQQDPALALHCHPTRCDDCAGHIKGVCVGRDSGCGLDR